MASLEKRSVSNLIELTADERWARLAEQQDVAFGKTMAKAMSLKLGAENPMDREKLRRAVLDFGAGRKIPKQKGSGCAAPFIRQYGASQALKFTTALFERICSSVVIAC
jgi:hypothetical protein